MFHAVGEATVVACLAVYWGITVNWFRHRGYLRMAAVVVFLPLISQGQTLMGSVTLNASVSDTVALSISPNSIPDNVHIVAQGGLSEFTMVLSGSGPNVVTFRMPVLIRSNISYVVSTLVQSQAVTSASFAVLDIRPSGRFVAQDAAANLKVVRDSEQPPTSQSIQTASLPLSVSSPQPILSGPRVSLSGTLNSPENALEVTFLISVKPDAAAGNWLLRLTLLGSAGDALNSRVLTRHYGLGNFVSLAESDWAAALASRTTKSVTPSVGLLPS